MTNNPIAWLPQSHSQDDSLSEDEYISFDLTQYNSGIGLETTILFAREGATVLMADISEPALEKALSKVHTILEQPPRIETLKCDVSKESDVEAMIKHLDSWGGVDIVFNNAGIMQ